MTEKLIAACAICLLAAGCVPLAIGGGAVVAADTIVEDREGGDGLF